MVSIFFFNDTATTEIYTLSLHDALPICAEDPDASGYGDTLGEEDRRYELVELGASIAPALRALPERERWILRDRKSTRLNSSHANISYAVFCLKKKKKI